MNSDHFVHFLLFTRRDWLCSLIKLRFYYLTCLNFSAELFLFVIFSTFSFVLVQLFFIYRLSLRLLRNHYLTLSLFNAWSDLIWFDVIWSNSIEALLSIISTIKLLCRFRMNWLTYTKNFSSVCEISKSCIWKFEWWTW
jgi:hypothetical protein